MTIHNDFPQTVELGGNTVEVRIMTEADRDAVLAFARALPEEDLLFLRVDLTDPEVVDDWVANLQSGLTISIVAYDDEGLIGYASVHKTKARWTRRVGELRVNVSSKYRSQGLGRFLTNRIFDVARAQGLRKLIGNMTTDQRSAQAAFRRLGFVPEAVLADYIEDGSGTSRDLLVMSYDIDGHSDRLDEPAMV